MSTTTKKIAAEFVNIQAEAIKKRLKVDTFDTERATAIVSEFLRDGHISAPDYESLAANKGMVADIIGTLYGAMAPKATKLRDATTGKLMGAELAKKLGGAVKGYVRGKRTAAEHQMSNQEFMEMQFKNQVEGR